MSFKKSIYSVCLELLDQKILDLSSALNNLTSGAENDSKSSAGDKHETGRAMMQIEHEKISRQLQEVISEKEALQKIDINFQSSKVIRGSLIKTDKAFLFLSVAIGKIIVEGNTVIVLSPQSPLGQKLNGLKVNDGVEVNGISYRIESVT